MKPGKTIHSILLSLVLLPVMAAASEFLTDYVGLQSVDGILLAQDGQGRQFALQLDKKGALTANDYIAQPLPRRPADILPDGLVTVGYDSDVKAWLGGPTRRYDHGVLADDIEASRLYVSGVQQQAVFTELPDHQVFEDRMARFSDLDGDGKQELVVIRSDVTTGAGIASYGFYQGQLQLEAASETIGLAHRWLNIVGIEDFTGDGRLEVAAVITPHIGGTLTLFRQTGDKLLPVVEQWGYSNHQYGSRELGMSAVLDFNHDGVMDLAVPDEKRMHLYIVSAKGGAFTLLTTIQNKAGIQSAIYAIDIDNDSMLELVYLLENGALVVVDA